MATKTFSEDDMGRSVFSGFTGAMVLATTTVLGSGALAQSVTGPSLTTSFNANNAFAGNMFNVNTLQGDLLVTGIDVNTDVGSPTIEVWTRPGSFVLGANTPTGWTLMSSNVVTSAGPGAPTFVDLTDFVLPGGSTTGFYVLVADYGSNQIAMNYTNGTGDGVIASNADLEITGGYGKGDPAFWGGSFIYRNWNGTIYYSSGPSVGDQLNALSQANAGIWRGVVSQAASIAARQARAGRSDAGISPTVSTSGTSNKMPVNTWFEFTGFIIDGKDIRQTAAGFQLGADVDVAPNMALGLSIGYDKVNSVAGGFDVSGDLTFLQPYLSYSQGPLSVEGSLIYGRGDYEQRSAGGVGSADAKVLGAAISGAYDFALEGGLVISPMMALSFGEETTKGKGGVLAGAGSTTTTFGRASVGTRLTKTISKGTAFVGLFADYDYSNGTTVVIASLDDKTGMSGRFEIGADIALTDKIDFRSNISVGGLGTGTKDVAAGLTFYMSF